MIPSIWVRRLILSVLVFSLGPSSSAELGDINGDRRVSFSDAHLFFEHEDIESPPGTVDWEEHVPCTFFAERAYKLLFLEALRRVTPGAPPQFFETWPTPGKAEAPAPEPSDRVQLSVLPLEYEGGASSLTLEVELTTSVELVGFEFERIDPFGETGTFLLDVEHGADFSVFCEPDEDPDTPCFVGFPFYNVLHNTARHPGETHAAATVPDGTLIVDLLSLHDFAHDPTALEAIPWEANREYVVGSAVFRIRKDAEPGNVPIAGVTVEWTPGGFDSPIVSECAGYPVLGQRPRRGDIPAVSVEAGSVRIALGDSEFLRGDTDGNDALELTDAVATLTALFITGEELSCEDAADTNDDGELNLSDPVFTLSPLFLGGPNPPEPFPENGSDPTPDALRCDRP